MNMNSLDVLKNEELAGDNSTLKKINSLLNSSKSRIEGLQLLNFFLPQCSDKDFLQYCISWMQNCCKSDGLSRNKDYAIHLLSNLLKKSSNYQELKKSVSFFITTRYFDFFFRHCLHSQLGWLCTKNCMLFYRGACGPFQENLENKLKNEIKKNVKISSTIAHCYALLPSVGGGGNEGVNYKKSWKAQFLKFLSIAHSILKNLFIDIEEFQEYEQPKHFYDEIQSENNSAYLAIQMHNHCSVLSWMLLSQYPSSKGIPTDLIFQLICRGLAVNSKTLAKRRTTDNIYLINFLPQIHCSLLSVLKAVIVTCKNQLLPYSQLVCKLIKQTLESTESEFTNYPEIPIRHLRVTAYEVLCNWLVATGSGSYAEVISNVVISNAVNDITSKEKVVFLKEVNQERKFRNKEHMAYQTSALSNDIACYAALKALQFLVKFNGILLKPEEHKFLQELVVKMIVQVQKSVSETIVPFTAISCRLGLYSVLLELLLQPCPKWPPPTHFAFRLFSQGLNDTSFKIASFCSMALSMMTVIIHPQYNNEGFPTFQSPENRSLREVELLWRKTSLENEQENAALFEENDVNFNGAEISQQNCSNVESSDLRPADPKEKLSNLDEESDVSSDEDSKNTVTFSKNFNDFNGKNLPSKVDEKQNESPTKISLTEEEPSSKLRRTSEMNSFTSNQENQAFETSSDTRELENKLAESDHSEPPNSSKSFSPESTSEEIQLKKRYFLRSKTKGSSEEPEEILKRTSSLDSFKVTPAKGSPKRSQGVQSLTKRPRTRALSKVEAKGNVEINTPKRTTADDDDEDIIATFDDSFVD